MSDRHPTAPAALVKPAKPNPEFPLTTHPAGSWCKKVRGKVHHFGPWSDPDGALPKYLEQRGDLHARRTPRLDPGGATVKDAANAFLNHKRDKMDGSELSVRTWAKYKEVTDLIVSQFGKSRLVADASRLAMIYALADRSTIIPGGRRRPVAGARWLAALVDTGGVDFPGLARRLEVQATLLSPVLGLSKGGASLVGGHPPPRP